MKTIEPEIQEKILDILPEDGSLALRLVAQLAANMILSIEGATIGSFVAELKENLEQYAGT
jgi:hypothetical protein